MKPKTHFRIVCLKNDEAHPPSRSNPTTSIISHRSLNPSQSYLQPSLVHLSARLQDESKQSEQSRAHIIPALQIDSEPSSTSIIPTDRQLASKMRPLLIEKYFEDKLIMLEKEKSTMLNIVGGVDFSPNRRKERKIARLIKNTIRDVCSSQRHSHPDPTHSKYVLSQNRLSLEDDFNNFLTNKKNQFARLEAPPSETEEEMKLKKLTIVNPEKEEDKKIETELKPLNLYHFQLKHDKHERRNISSMKSPGKMGLGNSRLEKKMFRMKPNLKTEEEEFEWSRLSRNNNFSFRTINH